MAGTLTDFTRVQAALGMGGADVSLAELSRLVEDIALSGQIMTLEPMGARYEAEWARERGQVFDLGRRHIYQRLFTEVFADPPWEIASAVAQEVDRRRHEWDDRAVVPELRSMRTTAEGAALRDSGLTDQEALEVLERVRVMVMFAARTAAAYDPAGVEASLVGLLVPAGVEAETLGEYRQYESTLREYLRGASVRSLTVRMPFLLGVVLRECRSGCPDDVMSVTLALRDTSAVSRMRIALEEYASALRGLEERTMAKCARKLREEVKAAREKLVSSETSAMTYVVKSLLWEPGWGVDFAASLPRVKDCAGVVRVGRVKPSGDLDRGVRTLWERVRG